MNAHHARTTANINRVIRRHISAAGYSPADITQGIAYAAARGDYTAREGYILAMSFILYGQEEADAGTRFGVEAGYGPR